MFERSSTIVDCIFVYIMNERMMILWLFAANCNDSNYIYTIYILYILYIYTIFIYTVSSSNSICPSFYFCISIIKCREFWFFLQSLSFRKNAHREGIGGTNSCAEGRSRRMGPAGLRRRAWLSGSFAFTPTVNHRMVCKYVKWSLLWYLCLN